MFVKIYISLMKIKLLPILIALAIPSVLFAQDGKVLKGSGLDKLKVLIGTWKTVTNVSNARSSVSTITFSPDRQFIISDQIIENAGRQMNSLSVYTYNARGDSYAMTTLGTQGMAPFTIPLTFKGDVMIFTGGSYLNNGKKVYNRTINTFINPKCYTYAVQTSADSINWRATMEGNTIKTSK